MFRAPRPRTRSSPTTLKLDLGTVEPSLAGPKRPQDRVSAESQAEVRSAPMDKEFKKAGDSTPRPVKAASIRSRPWRRGDRRHHLLHQHLQPERDDGAGLLARKAGELGLTVEAVGQDLARARLAGGRRIPRPLGPAERSRQASASTSSAMAAPPASAIPAPLPDRSRKPSTTGDLVAAVGAVRQPQFRGPRQRRMCARTISRRRRWSSPMRSPARCSRSHHRAARHRQGRQPGVPEGHLADHQGDRRASCASTSPSEVFAKKYADVFKGDANWRKIPVAGGLTLCLDNNSTYVQNPPYFEGMQPRPSR
jgi:aconitate hydratase